MDNSEGGTASSSQTEAAKAPAPARYVYIQEQAALESLVDRLASVRRVALDTEADSLHNYFEKVCLIQLSLDDEHYIVDPLAGLDLSEFTAALAEKPLILHGADYDLRLLRASLGFRPRREVFDTMIAAQLLGLEQIGLAALLEKFFNVLVGKEGQKSDWSRRPLSEKQLSYAVNDTRFLKALADSLAGQLSALGRLDWHKESCRAMVEATANDRARDPDDVWRIKGSGHLTRRQLAYLRELWHWRDDQARERNRPAFKILGNEQLFDLTRWWDGHGGAPLEQGPKLPRNIRDKLLRTLEGAAARATMIKPEDWPEHKKQPRPQAPSAELRARIDALRTACAALGKELGIAPQIIAPRAALEAIARGQASSVAEMMAAGGLLRWQAELMETALKNVPVQAPR